MIIKLTENTVSDLYKELGKYNFSNDQIKKTVEDLKDYLLRNTTVNLEDTKIVPINKPKSSTAARRSDNFLIGLTDYLDAVITGNDYWWDLARVYRGRGKYASRGIREAFNDSTMWFEIVPINPDTYQTTYDVRGSRRENPYYKDVFDYKDPYTGKTKQLYNFEQDLYDVDLARRKYRDKLTDIRSRKQYDAILASVEDINNRIRAIDFGHPIFDNNYNMTKLGEAYKDMKRSLDYFESKIKKDDYKIDNYDVNTVIRSIAAVNDKLKSFEKKANESLKFNVKESFDDVDNLNNGSCRGYGLLVRNMNTGYITLLCYNSKDLAEQNLTIGKLMEDETNYDYSMYDEDLDIIFSTAKFVVEEIDTRHDISYYKENERKVYVYGDDEDYYEIINEIPVDLYF